MQSSNNLGKRQKQEDQEMEDTEMTGTKVNNPEERRVLKVKRKQDKSQPMIDENGQPIEFEDSEEDEFIQEEVVQRADAQDSDDEGAWEDCDDENDGYGDEEMKESDSAPTKQKKQKQPKTEIWNDQKQPLKEEEDLEYDSRAYTMLHRAKVEWPCLSMDCMVKERCGHDGPQHTDKWFPGQLGSAEFDHSQSFVDKHGIRKHKGDRFPMTVYFCAGSQAEKKSDNKIYVMKWTDMHKTVNQDDDVSDSDEENDKYQEPTLRYESVSHRGSINRIRSMYGTPIVATWNEDGELGIYNVSEAMKELDVPVVAGKKQQKNYPGSKIISWKHKTEGYALDWSPKTYGRLAAGTCDAQIWLYQSADENCSTFVKETQVGLQGHKDSVEDVQWSPTQDHVLASCSCDQTIKLWDLRATQQRPQMSWQAHDCDVNVISWNSQTKFLLASGDDKGEFRIWDLRMFAASKGATVDSITRIRWHTHPITSIQFEPREDSVLAVASADNRLTLWDFSVEVDEQEQLRMQQELETNELEIPPQLMFLHQGQDNMKELTFHPQYSTLLLTTAQDSFNIFRPNLEPDEEDVFQNNEESKDESTTTADVEMKNNADVFVDDEDEEEEERRMTRTAKQLNKTRNARAKSKTKEQKRRRRQ